MKHEEICDKCGARECVENKCNLVKDFKELSEKVKKVKEACEESVEIFNSNSFYEDDFDIFMGEKYMAETILEILNAGGTNNTL